MAYEDKKEFEGRAYSGMRVGGIHRWNYPDGSWHERKVEPSRWRFTFTSHKHRRARAPEGSGAGVGSAYHWYVTAHQWVEKQDANTYATMMEGEKHLLGFRKPEWREWNTQFKNQRSSRERLIRVLEGMLEELREVQAMENPWDLPMFDELDILKEPVVEELVPPDILAR